jgi:hypothetical protein
MHVRVIRVREGAAQRAVAHVAGGAAQRRKLKQPPQLFTRIYGARRSS